MKAHEISLPQTTVEPRPISFAGNKKGYLKSKRDTEFYLVAAILIDLVLLNLILTGFMMISIPMEQLLGEYLHPFLTFLVVTNAIAFLVGVFTEVYTIIEGVRLSLKIKNLFWASLIFFGILSLVYYSFFFPIFYVHFLLPVFVSFLGLSALNHLVIRYLNEDDARFISYAVIGGRPSNLNYVQKVLRAAYGSNSFCLGHFAELDIPGIARLGNFDQVEQYLKSHNNINKLLYLDSPLSVNQVKKINKMCRSRFIDFEVVPTEMAFFDKGTQVEQIAHLPILRRKEEPLKLYKNRTLKRVFDIVISSMVILFIFPWLIPLVSLLIKLESKGPVLFTQDRTGYWNKPFKCYKFRTMRVNKESDEKQAVKNDARITRIGAILRKTNIDEFPQFFNVLKGDMSVVGPRPHMLKHTTDFSKIVDTFMIRHEVKPGITGWAQVNGWRGPTDDITNLIKRVEFDVNYIENWSFWFDCKCLVLTVLNMFKGEKNAF